MNIKRTLGKTGYKITPIGFGGIPLNKEEQKIDSPEKSYQDCTGCESCIKKCPYELNTSRIFKQTINDMRVDRQLNGKI